MNGNQFARQRALISQRIRTPAGQRKALQHLVRQAHATPLLVRGKRVAFVLPDGFVSCEKRRYNSAKDAQDDLGNIERYAKRHPNQRLPIRAYQCPHCHGWHLTSQHKVKQDETA